jgi:hypothetical protein
MQWESVKNSINNSGLLTWMVRTKLNERLLLKSTIVIVSNETSTYLCGSHQSGTVMREKPSLFIKLTFSSSLAWNIYCYQIVLQARKQSTNIKQETSDNNNQTTIINKRKSRKKMNKQ